MSDGFKYVDIFYKTSVAVPSFKVELHTTSITGRVLFSTLFYSDEQHTQYLGETANQSVQLGSNVFESGTLQYGNMSLYVIGRIKVVQGSLMVLNALKINDLAHIEGGSITVDMPSLSFTETTVNPYVYYSAPLGYIQDPTFQLVLQVQSLVGVVYAEYLYYTDEAYTQLHSTQSETVLSGTNMIPVETVNKYVKLQFKLMNGSRMVISSFEIQQVSQFPSPLLLTTPAYTDEFAVVSETCFPANTLITTDQGIVAIQTLKPHYHTIQGKSIVAITSTYSSDKELVLLRKDSIRKHYPNMDTYISRKHKIYLKGKLKAAYRLVEQYKGVSLVPYQGQMLFNVLLEDYGLMNIQGMLCETLHPMNPMAHLFRKLYPKIENTSKEPFLLQ